MKLSVDAISIILKVVFSFLAGIFDRLIFYWHGKAKQREKDLKEDVEILKEDAKVDALPDVGGDDLRDRLRNS